jgi:hypothetical protein
VTQELDLNFKDEFSRSLFRRWPHKFRIFAFDVIISGTTSQLEWMASQCRHVIVSTAFKFVEVDRTFFFALYPPRSPNFGLKLLFLVCFFLIWSGNTCRTIVYFAI